MRIPKKYIFFLLLGTLFAGCKSTSEIKSETKITEAEPVVQLRFSDWKYKGFGFIVSDWAVEAFNKMEAHYQKTGEFPILTEEDFVIFIGSGINSDMSDHKAEVIAAGFDLTGYELVDSAWLLDSETEFYYSFLKYKKTIGG